MPARVAASRSTRTSAVTRATPPTDCPEDTPETALRTQIATLFKDAQRSTAGHRKLVINLRKLQEACCYEPSSKSKNAPLAEDFDESDFNDEFVRAVLRVMPVKRSEAAGERVVRFIGLFLRHASEKDNELAEGDDDEVVETPASRLSAAVLRTVMPLMGSKEKFVRYRSTQLVSHFVNSLDSMDDDLFQLLRSSLLKRIRDKEAMVRVQVVFGLGRLAGNEAEDEEDSDSDDNVAGGLLFKLLDVLQNDPSADVRRSLLVNLPILPTTLPYLLERARDQDPATRRALYSKLLPSLGDFRHLSLSMREKLLRWGLRDRDENVRKAAAKLFRERWIEDCIGPVSPTDASTPPAPNFDALLELLERIDVVNSGVENGVAIEAMKGFWEGRPDYREAVVFDDGFWETLSAESVFMARSFNDYCRSAGSSKLEALVEEKIPEVTRMGYYLQRYINVLVEAIKRVAENEGADDEEEEDTVEQEFIVEQMLYICNSLDYSDEVGRRKIFALLRQSLAVPDLPEEVTKLIVEVLRGICAGDAAGEKEFISVVLEAVSDIHDTIMDEPSGIASDADTTEDSFHSAKSELSNATATGPSSKKKEKVPLTEEEEEEKAIREIMVNMKCLHIVQSMLQYITLNLQDSVDLKAMLNNLLVPAVRSHEAPVRERGLVCLGLCSLLDKSLAEDNLNLFIHFFTKGHAALQITALQIITDILTQHGSRLVDENPQLLKVYVRALKSSKVGPDVQAVATVSVCKLLLGRIITSPESASDLLRTLIVAYFDPSTASNQGVRQALSYFLPVYAYSRAENQAMMGSVAIPALHALFNLSEGYDDEEEEKDMVSLPLIGAHLVDWTDARKLYTPGHTLASLEEGKKAVNTDVHVEMAFAILEKLEGSAGSKSSSFTHFSNIKAQANKRLEEEKKLLAPLLGKLHISPASSEEKLRQLYSELNVAVDSKLVSDATGRNAILKLHVALGKIVNAMAAPKPARTESSTPDAEAEADTQADEEDETAQQTRDEEVEDLLDDDDDDEDALATQLNLDLERANEMDESMLSQAETSSLSIRPKKPSRDSREQSLVDELLSDEDDSTL